MDSKYWNIAKITWICVLMLIIGAGGAVGADTVPPQNEVLSLDSVSAAMDAEFSYQGVLKNNGTPVNGVRNFEFQIHDAVNCTNELQSIVKTGVPVIEGRFSVTLLVRHSYFNGDKLWLQVVQGTTRLMCEEILAVPYALSIMPGAEINNSIAEISLNDFDVQKNTAVGVDATAMGGLVNYGLKGSIDSGAGAGVYAVAGSANSRALVARNNGSGTAAYFHGNVEQNNDGYGVVKAGVYVNCGNPASSTTIFREFGPNPIGYTDTGSGLCELDFGFDLSERFWVSSSIIYSGAFITACSLKVSDTSVLSCSFRNVTETSMNGEMMILIY